MKDEILTNKDTSIVTRIPSSFIHSMCANNKRWQIKIFLIRISNTWKPKDVGNHTPPVYTCKLEIWFSHPMNSNLSASGEVCLSFMVSHNFHCIPKLFLWCVNYSVPAPSILGPNFSILVVKNIDARLRNESSLTLLLNMTLEAKTIWCAI